MNWTKEMTPIYLACPYSHEDKRVMRHRERIATAYTALLFPHPVFSPLTHGKPLEPLLGKRPHHEWIEQTEGILRVCKNLTVMTLSGWLESKGVLSEIEVAKELGMPVHYLPRVAEQMLVSLVDKGAITEEEYEFGMEWENGR